MNDTAQSADLAQFRKYLEDLGRDIEPGSGFFIPGSVIWRVSREPALLLVGFAGAFRRSELSAMKVDDLEWRPQGVIVTLRRGKTDQEGRGRQGRRRGRRGGPRPCVRG